uniref:Dynein-1, subspecies f n=1 Tax=Percolomonas cosmopolitus TaxID=63605 RepID=A0A7S1KN20_9EUKA|mmetsp:Transcript_10513/g.39074  ORF Transcript_10513/g.39074 Transcript_10513/m.39074 type:complete len:4422 (+) Transcript_10513:353-13618(+)
MNNDSFSNLPNGTSSTSTSTNNQLNFTLDQNLEGGLYLGPTQLHSLSLLLNGVYMPLLQTKQSSKLSSGVNGASKDTPHTAMVSYDFMNNLKKFSSQTYQTLTQLKGEVSLEIPQVDISDPKEASRDEQIVATIESKLEYWTQLIRSLLEQTIGRTREGDGPLSEIEFWRQRAAALGTFWEQLNDDAVKQMIEVLRHYDASQMLAGYEDQFQELTKMYMEAKDNVKFLETLERHFKNISRAQHSLLPISDTLPSMMRALRMVWVISRHYNTDKQMVPLLELIANEIADKVEDYLDFDKTVHLIFDQPEVVRSKLIEGKNVLRKWKKTYEKVKTEIENSERDTQWDFEPDPLFERTEYMHARCMDLIFIVDTIVKYKNFLGPEMEAGTGDKRGVEDVLKDVESLLVPIKKFPNVFDTKSEKRWKILMKEFKENVQEIEISINDFIDRSFVKIQSAEGAFKLLQDVKKIQSQDDDAIKHNMQLKSLHILDRFGLEVDQIKHIFDTEKDNPPRTKNLPPTAGSIYWSNSLFERIRTPILSISNDILDNNEKGKQIKDKCLVVANSIKEFEKNLFDSWKNNVTSAAMTYLKMNILDGDLSKLKGYVNFHPNLTLLIQESKYLDKLNKKVPELAQNVTLQEDKYHGYVENLKIMLDNFNSSVKSLEHAEYRILKPEIEKLMKTLQPGFTVLNWNSLGIEDFIKRCNKQIDNFQSIVTKVKRNTSIIRGLVNQIKNTVLVIDPRELKDRCLDLQQLYTILENHKNDQIAVVRKKYTTISQTLLKIEGDLISSNVIQDINENTDVTGRAPLIASYYEHWEKKIFRALTRMVLNSINRLSQFRKTPGIIRVSASLIHAEIVKTPDPEEVVKMMHKIMRSIIESTKCCIRWMSGTCVEITQIDIKKKDVKDDPKTIIENNFSFYTEISNMRNQVLTKARFAVVQGINRTLAKLHKLLEYYQKFSDYWKLPKEAAIQRFGEKKPSWEAFDERLEDCMKLIQDIQIHSKPIKDIHFIRVDISNLLRSIQEEARKWIDGFGRLLNTKIKPKLDALEKEIENYKEKLDADIQSINDLRNVLGVIDAIRNRSVDMERDYREVESCYNTLQIYNIEGVPNAEIRNASALSDKWERLLKKAAKRLKELEPEKEKFAEETKTNVLEFKKEIEALSKDFYSGPNNENTELSDGLKLMDRLRTRLTKVQETRDYLVRSEKLFELKITSYPVLVELERDMASVGKVYDLYREWKTLVDKWSKTLFEQIPIEEMKKQTKIFLGRLRKDFTKEIEDHHTHQNLRHLVDSFKKSIPLFENLKSDALRDRHWEELMEKTGVQFDPKIATLQNLIDMQLYKYEDQIDEIFSDAKKELKIEHLLRDVAEAWRNRKFEMKKHIRDGQDRGYILIGRDIIKEALEEDTTQLAGVSGSRHVAPFMAELSSWEKILSTIDEVIDLWWDVQNTWINLEVIFIGSQDIREQLQALAKEFDKLDSDWTKLMFDTSKNRLIKEACNVKGRRSLLEGLQQRLSACQKGLSAYLQTKRDAFPRFFYISDDELLSILGSSDPENVQTQIRKMFSNCGKLIFKQGGKVVLGMQSPEQEEFKFSSPVVAENVVEKWLTDVDVEMKDSLKQLTKAAVFHYPKSNRIGWIKENLGMVSLAGSQIWWTWEVEDAFRRVKDGDKTSVKDLSVKLTDQLNDLVDNVRTKLSSQERQKITTMIIIDVHARDIVDNLVRDSILDDRDFEWESQLRFYWDKSVDNCKIRQCSGEFDYGYEYMGLNGRLVITPLTDRCFMTLTQALTFNLGGSPAGPAGTGKTESVKDLAKSMALPVMVMNCGEGLDYKAMGRIFSGLCQNGAWGCFDEFNRIEIEVLSVVAQQMFKIISAIQAGLESFVFEGNQEISLNASCGIFVTMNPGYAGRTELPDNLKALLRPISMMVPDSALICEIQLFAQGFEEPKPLAKKIATLYSLMAQQLSKQTHYDFGLRNIIGVLSAAGALKREHEGEQVDEEVLLMTACADMNLPKFVSQDLPLFKAIMNDLFPGIELPNKDLGALQRTIEEVLENGHLQKHPYIIDKCIQLYETKITRHGVMVVGETGAGKSTVWSTLQKAMTLLTERGDSNFTKVETHIINPKAVNNAELFGEYNKSREWQHGILAVTMKHTCSDPSPNQKWMLFDGPVDTLWIESMNTVLDDNKILTLISGERITLDEKVSLLFEVQDLAVASPATVSRCGMVFFDYSSLGWEPQFDTWVTLRRIHEEKIESPNPSAVEKLLRTTLRDFVGRALELKQECTDVIEANSFNLVRSLTNLFDSLAIPAHGVHPNEDESNYLDMIQKYFIFSMIWSIGGTVDEEGRKKLDMLFREFDPQFPSEETVYEYYIDTKAKIWKPWDERVNKNWKPPTDKPFYKILVPTVDTTRNAFIIDALLKAERNILVTGITGTGKTAIIDFVLDQLPELQYVVNTVNFSAQTSSNKLQEVIEVDVEKKSFDTYAPLSGKQLVVFMDDFNMPQKDLFGSQPPLELIRQWIDYGFWYDRQKTTKKFIKKMQLVTAMGPPGGGRTHIPQRLQSRFNLINITFPSDSQLKRIFGTLLEHRFSHLEEVKGLTEFITQGTIEIYKLVTENLRPIPSKSHYVFNLRDMSKVFQGIFEADHESMDNTAQATRLWVHECYRVFYDRLIDDEDRNWFYAQICEQLSNTFSTKWGSLFKPEMKKPYPFGRILRGTYQEMENRAELMDMLDMHLKNYNGQIGVQPMNLVLFNDAVEHLCRIARIITQPRGHACLVGVGGSGRQSLTRLAAFISEMEVFSIEVTGSYHQKEFHEDLQNVMLLSGEKRKDTVFLLNDTQLVEESFLEDINTLLGSGEVPNLFDEEGMQQIYDSLKKDALEAGCNDIRTEIYKYFVDQSRKHLHVVICMSPVGESFRSRIRMYPALVNCTTLDWFSEWPHDALQEVALHFIKDLSLEGEEGNPELKKNIAVIFDTIHSSVNEESERMQRELKRTNYVTPTNYLELVTGYKSLLQEKRVQIGDMKSKLEKGLSTLEKAREDVSKMSIDLEKQKKEAAASKQECESLMLNILSQKSTADDKKQQVELDRSNIQIKKAKADKIREEAQANLDEALPALEAAEDALKNLDSKDISEIRAYAKPPRAVEETLCAVMVVLKRKASFEEAKKVISSPKQFIDSLLNYRKDQMSPKLLQKIGKITSKPDFTPDRVGQVSNAAKGLCLWVIALETYGHVYREVKPKKDRLEEAERVLATNQKKLEQAEAQLQELEETLDRLSQKYKEKVDENEKLRKLKESTEAKLHRAEQLVGGLEGERVRWGESIEQYKKQLHNLTGDVLVAAAFLSYGGPFDSEYRARLSQSWCAQLKKFKISLSADFSCINFLAKPTDVQLWNIQGLPSDDFSIENGALVTRGRRWPLMIDPQGQANKWIKNYEKGKLQVTDLRKDDLMRTLKNAIKFGQPVLIQDIGEEIDASLDPIIGKAVIQRGNAKILKLGDEELSWSENFRLYLTTKMANPLYTPEISTKTTIVNFAVTKTGLEEQLLGIVVKHERPELETQKREIVTSVAKGKKTMEELEDTILKLLTSASNPLEDESLVQTLQKSKSTSESISKQMQKSLQTEKKIDAARNQYRLAANRASILYFVLTDLSLIDPMYQFSLDTYIELFENSIENSDKPPRQDLVQVRVDLLNKYHTESVYHTTCQGLFEKDKLLFSFQMTIKLEQEHLGKEFNMDEYNFFLKGGQVLDKESQTPNPCPQWLPEEAWDNIYELDRLPSFHGIANSFEEVAVDWKEWYTSQEPENQNLPSEWQTKLNTYWERMIVVRAARADRVSIMVKEYIKDKMGEKYITPPVNDIAQIFHGSSCYTPFIFVLSPGVDPAEGLKRFAEQHNVNLRSLSLGQGQEVEAKNLISTARVEGEWVFLANCHLMIKWMPELEKIIETFTDPDQKPDGKFRLWLSSKPHPKFPITILQKSRKITTEPPQGLGSNIKRLYQPFEAEEFEHACSKPVYKRLLFSLAFFHSVLLERRKFGMLGWNIPYDFNDSDFAISNDILKLYLEKYDEIPWEALRFLIGEVNYGGRVSDDNDRRVLNVYAHQYFNDQIASTPEYKLCDDKRYAIPKDGRLDVYTKAISQLPSDDPPIAFGQHPNADISSQIFNSTNLLNKMLSLTAMVSSGADQKTPEDIVMETARDILENRLPEPIDTSVAEGAGVNALTTVLLQESQRYNELLDIIRSSLSDLILSVKGELVMTEELEEVFRYLYEGKVPPLWKKAYPSMKLLASWIRDFSQRMEQLKDWSEGDPPAVFWLSGFTFPSGFLTALKQMSARSRNVAIDELQFEFVVMSPEQCHNRPKEGAYIKGLFLEGAGWDVEQQALCEPDPMELIVQMPIIWFRPVQNKKKISREIFECPLYTYPFRAGTSFILHVELKCADGSPERYIKRGAGLLLSTAS